MTAVTSLQQAIPRQYRGSEDSAISLQTILPVYLLALALSAILVWGQPLADVQGLLLDILFLRSWAKSATLFTFCNSQSIYCSLGT